MSGLAFFDTNILLYADDRRSPAKRSRSINLICENQSNGRFVVSTQVLQEYYTAATRKLDVDPEVAQRKVQLLTLGRVVRIESEDVVAAIELHRLTRISFWDALIVHAARTAGASVLYSEDLQNGQILAGVPVVNPFLTGKQKPS